MNARYRIGVTALLFATLATLPHVATSAAPGDAPVAKLRLTPPEIVSLAGARAPNAAGVQSTSLVGDPAKPGLYTVRVEIAPRTQVRPHTHRDNRSVTVISGNWQMGYGTQFDAKLLKALPPGSVYTEPAGQPHFALAGDEPVVIWVTGYGPSDTAFVTP